MQPLIVANIVVGHTVDVEIFLFRKWVQAAAGARRAAATCWWRRCRCSPRARPPRRPPPRCAASDAAPAAPDPAPPASAAGRRINTSAYIASQDRGRSGPPAQCARSAFVRYERLERSEICRRGRRDPASADRVLLTVVCEPDGRRC